MLLKTIKRLGQLLKEDLSKDYSSYIFFITSKCNQRCRFCFYADNINKDNDLSLQEINLLSTRIANTANMLFSGGEPTLRKDLLEIVDIFVRNNKIKHLTIPSNGMSKDLICDIASKIMDRYPALVLQICISLDGPEELHDEIRGVKGAYKKAIESIMVLESLAHKYTRLAVNVNTVITPQNISFIKMIIQDMERFGIGDYTHSFEIVRPKDYRSRIVFNDPEGLASVYNIILRYKDSLYVNRLKSNGLKKLILGALHYANVYTLYKIQFDYSTKGKKWPMRCCSGLDDNVIFSNGDLAICELRPAIENIRNITSNKNFKNLFKKEYKKTRACCCTHICYILLSMYKSKKVIYLILPLRAMRYFFVKLGLLNYF